MVACLAGCLFCLSLAFLSCLSRDGLQEHDPKWIRAIECLSKIRVYMNLSHLPSFPRGTLFCCFITVASIYFLLLFSPFVLRCFTFIQLSYRNIRGSARSASDIVVAYRPANRAAAPLCEPVPLFFFFSWEPLQRASRAKKGWQQEKKKKKKLRLKEKTVPNGLSGCRGSPCVALLRGTCNLYIQVQCYQIDGD